LNTTIWETVNQNRVAYYVNGANSILRSGISDNIGKISGYGVGVYLEGSSKVGTAELDKDTPKLHFTNAGLGTTGNGIIGLFLSGDGGYSGRFKEFKERFGKIDLAAMESGQYNKEWSLIHSKPEDVLMASQDMEVER